MLAIKKYSIINSNINNAIKIANPQHIHKDVRNFLMETFEIYVIKFYECINVNCVKEPQRKKNY